MNATPATFLPQTPLDPARAELLGQLVDGLDASSAQWLSGFFSGVAYARGAAGAARWSPSTVEPAAAATPAARPESLARLAIVYGSQTGNGRRIAEKLARSAEEAGLATRVYAAGNYPLRDLAKERLLAVVMSTHGDGDPPDDARGFLEHLASKRAPRLEQLSYAVLALGDSSYPQFCETGRQVDERLATLGARRLLPRVDCDVDFERLANPWVEQALASARDAVGGPNVATVTRLRAVPDAPTFSRENPFPAEVLLNQRVTGRDATRDVRHIELSLEGSGLQYQPGDALGVWHENPPQVVEALLRASGLDGDASVSVEGQTRTLREWLTVHREITRLTRPFVAKHVELSGATELAQVLGEGRQDHLRRVLKDLQVVDLMRQYPADWRPKALVEALRPLAPRMYSIASSQAAVGDEAHLTVAVVDYEHEGQRRWGAASAFLAESEGEGARVRVFIEHNERFRLPADEDRDVIMIGPGTGVAPFRGFLQQRDADGATGRNWLFFGARHFSSEFLYQVEWQEALRKGQLTRLDVAFSRDRTPRAYVQDRIREAGHEFYQWLEGGAVVYVCGDAERMAPDVHEALIEVVVQHGGVEREAAEDYVRRLADERRYVRDVY